MCINLTAGDFNEMKNLQSSQEEAETRMMLHINDAAMEYSNIVCVFDDTDVLLLSLHIVGNQSGYKPEHEAWNKWSS